jgi:hypothetical protein
MSIQTAQQKILDTLPDMDIDVIDDAKMIRMEGNLLVFEGSEPEKTKTIFVFGLYIAKKILNKNTSIIYADLDNVEMEITKNDLESNFNESIEIRSITQNGFQDGILEYRCEIAVTETKMKG